MLVLEYKATFKYCYLCLKMCMSDYYFSQINDIKYIWFGFYQWI